MKLHAPFIIGARLLPALRIGDAFLSLEGMTEVNVSTGKLRMRRMCPAFILDIGSQEYRIDDMQSGAGGFRSVVEPFEMLLSFMSACAESIQYRQRTGHGGDNADLFAPAVAQWCADNSSEIESAQCAIQDESGEARHELIEA
jgi:hypothetical protein